MDLSLMSQKTQISRKVASAPVRFLVSTGILKDKIVLYHGEGQDQAGTELMESVALSVNAYDPYSPNEYTRKKSNLMQVYELGLSVYVFNTLPRDARMEAYQELRDCSESQLIVLRSDKIHGTPYEDGAITKRGTFQKRYTPLEAEIEFGGRAIYSNSSYIVLLVN